MISSEVRNFLTKYVDSAELLDILMLLFREPDQEWTPESVSNRVFTVPQAAERRLEELKERGLLAERTDRPGAYQIAVSDPGVTNALNEVRQAYEASRAELITFVFSLKADPVQSFSNAFRLRSDS